MNSINLTTFSLSFFFLLRGIKCFFFGGTNSKKKQIVKEFRIYCGLKKIYAGTFIKFFTVKMTSHQIMISCFLYACNSVVFPNFYKRLLFLAELCSHFISRKFFSSCFDFSSFVPANLRCFKMDRKLNNSLFNTLH